MKKHILLLLVMVLCLCVAACVREQPTPTTAPTEPPTIPIPDLVFTKTQVKLIESENGIGAGFSLNKNLDVCQWNGVTYAFEPGISLTDRQACIQTTDAVLNRIGAGSDLQICIYTTESYDETFLKNGAVFTHLQDWQSPEYIAALIQGIFGEYCNYGAAYGYAGFLGNALFGLPLKVCEADWVFEGEQDLLDLNTLCFHIRFLAGKDVKTATRIANTFVSEYIQKNGEAAFQKLLIQSGTTEEVDVFVAALSDFYASRKIDYTPSPVLYRSGGEGYDYIVKCPYGVLYMEKDFTDRNEGLCPELYENFLHQNYSDVKQYFTTNIAEMGSYQALLALESYDNDLDIYYTNHNGRYAANYIAASHSIAIQTVSSLSTAYLSALMHQTDWLQDGWATTGFLQVYGCKYNAYGQTLWNYLTNVTHRNDEYSQAYYKCLGRDVDFATDIDVMCHIDACKQNKTDPNSDYTSGGSFIAYLISRFGEETVLDILLRTNDFGEYPYEELVSDWLTFLETNYSEYA